MVVGTAERHIQIFTLSNPTTIQPYYTLQDNAVSSKMENTCYNLFYRLYQQWICRWKYWG